MVGAARDSPIEKKELGKNPDNEPQNPTGNEKIETGKRITNALMIVVAAIAIGGLTAGLANAAIIPSTEISSSACVGVAGSHISRVINGSGLSAALTDANYTTVTHAVGFIPSMQWLANDLGVDGSTVTFISKHPHELTVDQGKPFKICGVGYLPRSGGSNGAILNQE